MSLEKWLKTEKMGKESKEKTENVIKKSMKKMSSNEEDVKSRNPSSSKFKKHVLICSKPKCKYQKTIMKNKLSERDKICPKCHSKMKEK